MKQKTAEHEQDARICFKPNSSRQNVPVLSGEQNFSCYQTDDNKNSCNLTCITQSDDNTSCSSQDSDLPRQLLLAVYCKLLRDPEKQTSDRLASFPFCLSRKRQKSSSPPVKRLNPNTDTVGDNKGRLEGRIHGPAVHVALTS